MYSLSTKKVAVLERWLLLVLGEVQLEHYFHSHILLLLTEREVCMGELPVQTERSEVCTSNRGQDSPIQTDLTRLIRCLLYGQTRKQRNKNINNFICFPFIFACSFLGRTSNLPMFARFLYLLPREGPLILPFSIYY